MGTSNPSTKTVEDVVADWPSKSKAAARELLAKYGEPDEATLQRLIWHDNGPWTRTVLHRDGPSHRFPVPHTDYLEQYVEYRVPPEKFDDLARFDGSVHAHRTRGELGASCHEEGANVLALNLAHDVITGERTVEQAREDYGRIMAKGKAGRTPEYMRALQFEVPRRDVTDPDETIVTAGIKQRARNLVGGLRGD